MKQPSAAAVDYSKSPIALFYLLEDARRRNDFERASQAQKQLRSLGVDVSYHSPEGDTTDPEDSR